MRDILETVVDGSLSPAKAEVRLSGYMTTGAGRFDATRETWHDVPEVVLAKGKTPDETATPAIAVAKISDYAPVARTDTAHAEAVADTLLDTDIDRDVRAKAVAAATPELRRPDLNATVVVATDGTSGAEAMSETATVLYEMGVDVEWIEDMGVTHPGHALNSLDALREADMVVVAVGREGALLTVITSPIDTPVVGLSVSTGYDHDDDGKVTVLRMLQSCTILSAVSVDIGYIAGTQAEFIARAVTDACNDDA